MKKKQIKKIVDAVGSKLHYNHEYYEKKDRHILYIDIDYVDKKNISIPYQSLTKLENLFGLSDMHIYLTKHGINVISFGVYHPCDIKRIYGFLLFEGLNVDLLHISQYMRYGEWFIRTNKDKKLWYTNINDDNMRYLSIQHILAFYNNGMLSYDTVQKLISQNCLECDYIKIDKYERIKEVE